MKKYWKIPPEIYAKLNRRFSFDFDPCPYPRADYNALAHDAQWGAVNWVNPPFCKADAPYGGPSAFAHKGIAQQGQGKTSVFVLPLPHSIGLLGQAGGRIEYLDKVAWLDADTDDPCPQARHQALIILGPGQ